MTTSYLVSALISAYNSEKFIGGCLRDLVCQSLYAKGLLQIIVVDSGSEQNERAIVEEFQKTHQHIIYLRTERETLYAAWNRAIKLSNGKYITNANADDRHRMDALELLAHALEQRPDIDLVYGDCYATTIANQTFEQNDGSKVYRYPDFSPPSCLLYFQFGPQPMWRKNVHEVIGYFDGRFKAAGDYDFNIRFALAGRQALRVPEVLGLYLEHSDALSFKDNTMSLEVARIHRLYRTFLAIKLLYWHAGVLGEFPGDFARMCLDLAFRAYNYYPAWTAGAPERDYPFIAKCYLSSFDCEPGSTFATNVKIQDMPSSTSILISNQGNQLKTENELSQQKKDINHEQRELLDAYADKPTHFPKVSVIIPCYNYGHYLTEAVYSVLHQTYQNFEIIIVNDGSTDNSQEIAEKIIARNNNYSISLISTENSGKPAISRNRGISAARGEYILCLDADDLIMPTMLEMCVDYLDVYESISIVYTDQIKFNESGSSLIEQPEYEFGRLLRENFLNYCALFRKKAWIDVGGYADDVGYEDWDFWISCAEKGYIGKHLPQPLFAYRFHGAGQYSKDVNRHNKILAQIYLKHAIYYQDSEIERARKILQS